MVTQPIDFPMPIITPRLILRKPTPSQEDCQQYVDAVTESMPELSLWLPWARRYPSLDQAQSYLNMCDTNWNTPGTNNYGLTIWMIEKNGGLLVGSMSIWSILWDIPKFEFGYWVRTSQANNGYITEAVNAMTYYCFEAIGVKRIEIRCEIENIRAQLIPKRLKYDLDGILRNSTRAIADGKLTDTVLFSCTDLKNVPKIATTWSRYNKY